jgi:hypothetical protein
MIGDPFSDEVPAGYTDADLEQAELERLGRASARARARGECAHGSRRGDPGNPPPRADDIEACLHCGKVATCAELDADAREVLGR